VVSFPLTFPPIIYTSSSSPIRATWPAHLILCDLIILIILGEEYISWSSLLCNFLHSAAAEVDTISFSVVAFSKVFHKPSILGYKPNKVSWRNMEASNWELYLLKSHDYIVFALQCFIRLITQFICSTFKFSFIQGLSHWLHPLCYYTSCNRHDCYHGNQLPDCFMPCGVW
jgi:hypothetical protein